MDATPQRFAYRCLPLNIANAHGWEVLCPVRTRAVWFGGQDMRTMTITPEQPHIWAPISHFGSGVLTFRMPFLVQTEPGYELWVSGPPNVPKHGIAPLSGVVETDWSPYTFTMNWKFTAPGEVVFEKDEPICFFFPIARATLPATEPEFRFMGDNKKINEEFETWRTSRTDFNNDLKVEGSKAREEGWQRSYFQGVMPLGEPAPEGHRTKQRVKPFKPVPSKGG